MRFTIIIYEIPHPVLSNIYLPALNCMYLAYVSQAFRDLKIVRYLQHIHSLNCLKNIVIFEFIRFNIGFSIWKNETQNRLNDVYSIC